MSNLKKVLSVGLASTMVMGMMTTAGAASYEKFTDKADIEHKDAVSMVSELGIIAGLTNGTYAPKQNIDRASFARLVCVALNGGKEPNLGNLKTSFTDTQGHWAEKYIAYCVDRGIIAGRGDGTFAPSANVTGSEAAKMLLVALGYNTKYEGIGGATWQTTTDVLANLAGLYDDLESMNTSAPLTRDNAAQMIYNALDADTVTYSWTYNANGTSVAVQNKTGKTMLEDKFNAIKVEGVVTANEFADLTSTAEKGSSKDDGKTYISVTNYGDDEDQKVFKSGTYSVTTGKDELGKSITLYVKNDSGNSSKATVLGSAVMSEDNKVATIATNKDVEDLADDNDLDIVSSTLVVDNYGKAKKWGDLSTSDKITLGAKKDSSNPNRGITKTLIDNDDDGDVDYILLEKLTFGQVSKKSEKDDGSITVDAGSVKGLSADKKKDVVGFDDVKEDDYVLAAWIGGDLHVQKAESVSGTLDAYKSAETVTVSGTKYDMSNVVGYKGGDDDIVPANKIDKDYLDKDAVFYLDQNGLVVAMGEAEADSGNYAYVWASDVTGSGVDSDRVKVTLQDGTTGTYTLASGSVKPNVTTTITKTTDNDQAGDRVYAYSINSKKEIKLTNAKQGTASATTTDFNKNKTAISGLSLASGKNQTKYATSNTAFFYVSVKGNKIDDVDVYTGYTKAPSVDGVYAEAAYNAGGKMAAVAFTGTKITSKDVADFLYVTKVLDSTTDYTNVKAILAGTNEVVDLKVDIDDTVEKNTLYLYSVDKDGVYTLTAASTATSNYTTDNAVNISSTTVATKNDEYKLTDKTVWVEQDKDGDYDSVSLGKLPSNDSKGEVTTILYNSDKEILAIVSKDSGTSSSGGSTGTTTAEITVKVDASNAITVTYTGSEKPAVNDVVKAIRVKLAKENGISDYTKVTGKTADSAKFTFTVDVDGMEVTYPVFDYAKDVTKA